jgi:DNA-binding transcriptional LysR family regulator
LFRNYSSALAIEHLRYAVSAANHCNFRNAAEPLLLRQSTLSRRIRQLEETIGIVVFERSSGGVCATPTGRDFLSMARSILEQLAALGTSRINLCAYDI